MTPPACNKEAFREQTIDFLNAIMPVAEVIEPLFAGVAGDPLVQFRYDATMSIAFDAGIELFMDSPLPALVAAGAKKGVVHDAMTALPVFDDRLRPELTEQMQLYKMTPLPRREYEYRLYCGEPYFTIGPTLNKENEKVFAPSVMHPFYRFLLKG